MHMQIDIETDEQSSSSLWRYRQFNALYLHLRVKIRICMHLQTSIFLHTYMHILAYILMHVHVIPPSCRSWRRCPVRGYGPQWCLHGFGIFRCYFSGMGLGWYVCIDIHDPCTNITIPVLDMMIFISTECKKRYKLLSIRTGEEGFCTQRSLVGNKWRSEIYHLFPINWIFRYMCMTLIREYVQICTWKSVYISIFSKYLCVYTYIHTRIFV